LACFIEVWGIALVYKNNLKNAIVVAFIVLLFIHQSLRAQSIDTDNLNLQMSEYGVTSDNKTLKSLETDEYEDQIHLKLKDSNDFNIASIIAIISPPFTQIKTSYVYGFSWFESNINEIATAGKNGASLGAQAIAKLGKNINNDLNKGRDSLLARAKSLLGKPYKWGGESLISGFDCSGLIRHVFESSSIILPRTSTLQAKDESLESIDKDRMLPGDMVFFKTIGNNPYSHVGLYVGDNKFLHAPKKGDVVRIDKLDNIYWKNRFTIAKRSNKIDG